MRKQVTLAHTGAFHAAWPDPIKNALGVITHKFNEWGWQTIKYRVLALAIIGLVLATAAGWALLGSHELALLRSSGSPAVLTAMTPLAQQAQANGALAAAGVREAINPAALMPWWMAIDLLIFVALGLYLRWDLGRKA